MLMSIDRVLRMYPSRFMNWVTFGQEGASLCARSYLYKNYVSRKNIFVNFIVWATDIVEPGHCAQAARLWRIRIHRKSEVYPTRYILWFKQFREFYKE